MNKLTRISQERPAPTVLEHDQPSRTGKGVPLVNHPKWVTVSELVRAWAKELADARTGVYELQDKLWYHLEKDVINGLLDDPLRDGSRLGLRAIAPGGGQSMYIEGRQLSGLFRTMGEVILISKEAALEFARRHKVRPPSWCDASKGEIQPSRSLEELKPASEAMTKEEMWFVCNTEEAAGRKPPNVKELSAAVQPLLQRKGFWASRVD